MIPTIDPRVKYVGASHLRKLNSTALRSIDGVIVVRDNSEPLVVIVPYGTYLALQSAVRVHMEVRAVERGEMFRNEFPTRELSVELDKAERG